MLRALIIEDNLTFRDAFKAELSRRLPLVLLHEAGDAREGLEKIRLLAPSLVFMDICLPGANGLELARSIKEAFPGTRIAVLTGHDLPEYRRAARQSGADRFLVKDALDWREIEELALGPSGGKGPGRPRAAREKAVSKK